MKTIRLLIGIMVALVLFGCGEKANSLDRDPNVINLGEYVFLATINNGYKVVTYYPDIGVVCFENGNGDGKVYTGSFAAFTCWGKNEAPPLLQKLIDMYWLRLATEVAK